MYNTDFIVRYHDIENELIRRLEIRLATEAAAEITAAIESVFRNTGEYSNENIVINVEVGGNSNDDNDNEGRQRIEIVNSNRTKNATANTTSNATTNAKTNSDLIKDDENDKDDKDKDDKDKDAEDDEEDYKYNRKDVTYICEKLYRDELLSAFGAESIDDPAMDTGIKTIFEALINNEEFKQFLSEMNALLLDPSTAKTETELANLKRNTDYLIFITLFSQQSFYLTHKCLCQMLTLGHVEADMMEQLKQRSLKIFQISNSN
jgi:hypothetical protein